MLQKIALKDAPKAVHEGKLQTKVKTFRRKGNVCKSKAKASEVTSKETAVKRRPKSKLLELKKQRDARLKRMSQAQTSSSTKSSLSKYEMRYRRLKRLAKDLVFVSEL